MAVQLFFRTYEVTTEESATVPLEFPSETVLTAMIISEKEKGSYSATLYNHPLSGKAHAVYRADSGPDDKVQLTIAPFTDLNVGDYVTVANLHADYNGAGRRVLAVDDSRTKIVLDVDYDTQVIGGSGTLQPAVPDWVVPIYTVIPQQTASDGIVRVVTPPNVSSQGQNRDTRTHRSSHRLYLQLSAAGTYAISLSGELQR